MSTALNTAFAISAASSQLATGEATDRCGHDGYRYYHAGAQYSNWLNKVALWGFEKQLPTRQPTADVFRSDGFYKYSPPTTSSEALFGEIGIGHLLQDPNQQHQKHGCITLILS